MLRKQKRNEKLVWTRTLPKGDKPLCSGITPVLSAAEQSALHKKKDVLFMRNTSKLSTYVML